VHSTIKNKGECEIVLLRGNLTVHIAAYLENMGETWGKVSECGRDGSRAPNLKLGGGKMSNARGGALLHRGRLPTYGSKTTSGGKKAGHDSSESGVGQVYRCKKTGTPSTEAAFLKPVP